jgi:hypothetical protein
MIEDRLYEIIDPALKTAGAVIEAGEEYRAPPLDVLRYYYRPVRLHWMWLLGRASSVVAVVRQPVDVGFQPGDYRRFLTRLALAVNGRFPPWAGHWPRPWVRGGGHSAAGGLVIGLTVLVLTPEPIGPDDDAILAQVLSGVSARQTRTRVVPLGLLRVNLGQEALALTLAPGPTGLFAEPEALTEVLSLHLRRFVQLIDA